MQYSDNKLFYARSVAEYGVSPKGVHWNSTFNQYKRFEILISYLLEELDTASFVDIGCGFGDLLLYCHKHHHVPKNYIGIDCESFMVDICKKRFPKQEFIVKNVLEDDLPIADYYICSGALNILNEKEFFTFIENCYAQSSKGFVFNFLIEDTFTFINKEKVLRFCKELSNKVTINQDYLYNDMTIFMEK